MRTTFGSRVLNRIASCGLIFLFMMSAMSSTAAAETPEDIAYEWVDFLSLLPEEDQAVWDNPESFEFWLVGDLDPSVYESYEWGGLTLAEIIVFNYPVDEEEDPDLTDELYEIIYEDPTEEVYEVIYEDPTEEVYEVIYEDPTEEVYEVIYEEDDPNTGEEPVDPDPSEEPSDPNPGEGKEVSP